jgi:hypothetical protein
MALNPQQKQETGPRIPNPAPGVVPGRIARVIEIGEHDTFYGTKDQVIIYVSLPTRIIDMPESDYHGKQHMVRSKPLRKSSNEKASLMKDWINVLHPQCTDLRQLLNLPCFVNIQNNKVETNGEERTFTNIIQVSGVPEGIEVGEVDTSLVYFDFDNPDEDVWNDQLWDSIREKIMSAKNYHGSAVEKMVLHLQAMKAE